MGLSEFNLEFPMAVRACTAVWVCAGFVLLAGCSEPAGTTGATAGSSKSAWKPFPLPDYARPDMAELRKPAAKEIEQHRDEIEALFAEREALPDEERYVIPSGEDARMARDIMRDYLEFRRARDLQGYIESTSDQGPTLELGKQFLEEYLKVACSHPDAKTVQEVIALGEKTLAAGSDDPVIQCCQARMRKNAGETDAVNEILKAQQPRLNHPKIRPLTRALVAMWLWELNKDRGDEMDQRPFLYGAIDRTVDYLVAEAGEPTQLYVWTPVHWLYGEFGRETQSELIAACWKRGGVNPWVTHYMAGIWHERVAWDHRGSGFANTVTEEGWKGFQKNGAIAYDHFLRAWQLDPSNPMAAEMLIKMARSGHSDRWSVYDWFYEAVRAQADFMSAYTALQFAVTPRWGGSHQHMLRLARDCVATGRYDTCIPAHLLTTLYAIELETADIRYVAALPGVAQMVAKYAREMTQALDDGVECPANTVGNWGYLAQALVLAKDYETARMIYERHDPEEVYAGSLSAWNSKMSHARGLAFAMTGPASENVLVFEELLRTPFEEEPDPAIFEEFRDLLAKSRELDEQPQSQPYYNDIEAVVRQLEGFYAGEWVELPFDEELSGWLLHANDYRIEADGGLRVSCVENGSGIHMRPMAPFAPPFVCEAELALGDPLTRSGAAFPGIAYGKYDRRALYDTQPTRALYLTPHEQMVWIFDETEEELTNQGRGTPRPDAEYTLLRLKVWENAIDYSVAHQDVLTAKMPEGAQGIRFTIGERQPQTQANHFTVRNARIKRLTHGPPPTVEDLDRWIAFNIAESENDPLDPNAWFHLGYGYALLGEHEQALESFRRCESLKPLGLDTTLPAGGSLAALGRCQEALVLYQRALERDGNSTQALTGLAWVYAAAPDDAVRNGTEALRFAQRACEASNYEDPQALIALAAAHAEMDDFDAARRRIDEALAKAPMESKGEVEHYRDVIYAGRKVRIDPERQRRLSAIAREGERARGGGGDEVE